ncbi:unnamed protein product, partial [Rotaria socialis]
MISITSSATDRTFVKREQRCHRGIELTVWLDDEKNLTTSTCLCPPSFYGDDCTGLMAKNRNRLRQL